MAVSTNADTVDRNININAPNTHTPVENADADITSDCGSPGLDPNEALNDSPPQDSFRPAPFEDELSWSISYPRSPLANTLNSSGRLSPFASGDDDHYSEAPNNNPRRGSRKAAKTNARSKRRFLRDGSINPWFIHTPIDDPFTSNPPDTSTEAMRVSYRVPPRQADDSATYASIDATSDDFGPKRDCKVCGYSTPDTPAGAPCVHCPKRDDAKKPEPVEPPASVSITKLPECLELGTSARYDFFQGQVRHCAIDLDAKMTDDPESTVGKLRGPYMFPHLGTMGILPLEMREKIWQKSMPTDFWHVYRFVRGKMVLEKLASSPMPAILRTSGQIRSEVLDAASINSTLTIIIGTHTVAFNFPVVAQHSPASDTEQRLLSQVDMEIDLTTARIPSTRELFIGIQTPSPRGCKDMLSVRENVETVASMLKVISSRQNLPRMRVSFETNKNRSTMSYYSNNFLVLFGPLYKIFSAQRSPDMLPLSLVIDRSSKWIGLRDRRGQELCRMVEDAVCTGSVSPKLVFRQLMIDIKLKLGIWLHYSSPSKEEEMLVDALFVDRMKALTGELTQWYAQHNAENAPPWLRGLHQATLLPDTQGVSQIIDHSRSILTSRTDWRYWAEGTLSVVNPYWDEATE